MTSSIFSCVLFAILLGHQLSGEVTRMAFGFIDPSLDWMKNVTIPFTIDTVDVNAFEDVTVETWLNGSSPVTSVHTYTEEGSLTLKEIKPQCLLWGDTLYKTGDYQLVTRSDFACSSFTGVCRKLLQCHGYNYKEDPSVKSKFAKLDGVVALSTTCKAWHRAFCRCPVFLFPMCHYIQNGIKILEDVYIAASLADQVCLVHMTVIAEGKTYDITVIPGTTAKAGPYAIGVTEPMKPLDTVKYHAVSPSLKKGYSCLIVSAWKKPVGGQVGEVQMKGNETYRASTVTAQPERLFCRSLEINKKPISPVLESCVSFISKDIANDPIKREKSLVKESLDIMIYRAK